MKKQLLPEPFRSALSLFMMNEGEAMSSKITAQLSKHRTSLRATGGCGEMNEDDGNGIYETIAPALKGFTGNIIVGGTRMYTIDDKLLTGNPTLQMGITEVAEYAKRHYCPQAQIFGIVGKTSDIRYLPQLGTVLEYNKEWKFVTVMNTALDVILQIQPSVDKAYKHDIEESDKVNSRFEDSIYARYQKLIDGDTKSQWVIEFLTAWQLLTNLWEYAQHKSALLAYNGGGTTLKEIQMCAKAGWDVILVKGSGRKTDEACNDRVFLDQHPNVIVVDKDPQKIRRVLFDIGIMDPSIPF